MLKINHIQKFKRISNTSSYRYLSASVDNLSKTACYDYHVELGGKIVPFANYYLPVQYDGLGVLKEHLHTRSATGASLFDVSHMGQIKWYGKDAIKFIEKVAYISYIHHNKLISYIFDLYKIIFIVIYTNYMYYMYCIIINAGIINI